MARRCSQIVDTSCCGTLGYDKSVSLLLQQERPSRQIVGLHGPTIFEHFFHMGDILNVPVIHNGLLEGMTVKEHVAHGSGAPGIPVGQSHASETGGTGKSSGKVRDTRNIPTAQILVKGQGAGKDPAHRSGLADIPVVEGFIEADFPIKQIGKVLYVGYAPLANGPTVPLHQSGVDLGHALVMLDSIS